jgi:hypothetical protein
MDDTKYGPTVSWSDFSADARRAKVDAANDAAPAADAADAQNAGEQPAASPAAERFQSCRWRATPDAGEYCTHRDVLPLAGKEGFNAESWCLECGFYKLRRTPKKRERDQDRSSDYLY